MPWTSRGRAYYYEIAVRQFVQQILPPQLPATTVWSYGSINHPGSFHYPAFTIEARYRRPVRVKWINDLVDAQRNFLPHLLAVDPTLHWANPPGGAEGRDSEPSFAVTPKPYDGPSRSSPTFTATTPSTYSDGYAEAWFLPDARNLPSGIAAEGTFYDFFRDKSPLGDQWSAGNAVFEYPNDQRANDVVPRPHAGDDPAQCVCGPGRFLSVAARAGRPS